MHFKCRIPIPMEVKEEYSVSKEIEDVIKERNKTIADVIKGEDSRPLLIIGPCSADIEDSVIDYISRIREAQDENASSYNQ